MRVSQDQRLKEISMQTPPSASPSSQSIGSANNNHITQNPELFTSTLSANRCVQKKQQQLAQMFDSSIFTFLIQLEVSTFLR